MNFDPIEGFRRRRARASASALEFFRERAELQLRERAHTAFTFNGGTEEEFAPVGLS